MDFRRIIAAEAWEDGRSTAGSQSAEVKKNEQLPPDGKTSRQLGERILRALSANTLFVSARVPLHIFPPLFNRYVPGQFFGEHIDNCIRGDHLTGLRIRTDLSVTLFLSEHHTLNVGGDVSLSRRRFVAANLYYGSGFLDGERPGHLSGHTIIGRQSPFAIPIV